MQNLTAANAATKLASAYPKGTLVDSHQFQRDMMAQFRTEFALDFLEYIDKNDPLHSFSLAFGQWLARDASVYIQRHSRNNSKNLRGDNTKNQVWEIL